MLSARAHGFTSPVEAQPPWTPRKPLDRAAKSSEPGNFE